jgi:hypothetical protein
MAINNIFLHNKLTRKTSKNLTRLLISLIVIFFLAPFSSSIIGYSLMTILFLIINLLIVNLLYLPKIGKFTLRTLAVLASLFDLSYANQVHNLTKIMFLTNFFYAIFIILAIISLGSIIFREKKVDLNIINGGISIFLLLAFLWFNFYSIILAFDPTAFKGLSAELQQQYQIFYFSFTTITTLGYGDITPVNKFAMSLANAQAIVGLMYPAIFIARLVSLYTTQSE